ncbi:nucleoside diphosphate kinase homolog 5 [Trichonephila clavata]|uniref:Nucleoside diphosphate kinase homolog 5 n=1 Tax=Trichonephila clavata TaxID=2740835 RepID=A0A8X6GP71_TRICU|nr:nucleoside diphosphate kinase homolog 5 [Trichonephila clavata]
MAEKGETSKSPQKEEQYKEFERTLALIKPNAVTKSKSIQALIKKEGLLILKKRRTYLKPEQVRNFFLRSLDEEDNKYFRIYQEMMEAEASGSSKKNILPDIRVDNLEKTVENSNMEEYVDFMTGGPVELFILAGRGAIFKWQELMGPEDPKMARILKPDSIRAKFGGENILRNAVYGSEDAVKAEEEIRFFFPEVKSEADDKMKASGEYLSKTVNPILLKGLIQLCRQKPDNPLVWLADWLLANNPINEQG